MFEKEMEKVREISIQHVGELAMGERSWYKVKERDHTHLRIIIRTEWTRYTGRPSQNDRDPVGASSGERAKEREHQRYHTTIMSATETERDTVVQSSGDNKGRRR